MNHKRLLIIVALLSALILGATPTLAQDEVATNIDLVAHLDNYLQDELPQGWGVVGAEDLFTEMLENPPFLLDVREPDELEENGYILGAVNVPVRQVAQNLDLLPAELDALIVVYCKAGTRGAIVMTALQVLGYSNVRNLAGGLDGWIGAEFEVITDPIEQPEPGEMAASDPELVAFVDDYLQNVLPQGWGVVKAEDLFTEMLETPPFLLDVRQPEELDELGYIEGAINVPAREVAANLDMLPDTDTPIVVYCKGGHRGAIAMVTLQMLGYDVRNLAGGIGAWLTAGYEVVGAPEQTMTEEVEIVLPTGEVLPPETIGALAVDSVTTIALSDGFGTVTAETFAAEYADALIIDVREPAEYEEGFIEGAVNIPIRELTDYLYLLPEMDAPIVVYCSAGHRGALAQMSLDMLGYENVVSLRSGLRAWGGELVTAPVPEIMAAAFPEVDDDLWVTLDDYLGALPQGFGTISAEDLSLALTESPPALIDVREASEHDAGHIEGAVNMPTRTFTEFADNLPAMDTPIVMYGSIGHRSALTVMALQLMGYQDVRSLNGGTSAWTSAGFELVSE